MSNKAPKLLQKMRQTKKGWKPDDLIALYVGYGFLVSSGGSHYKVKHPDFLEELALRTTIPFGSSELAQGYVHGAIKHIELLERLQEEGKKDDE